MHDISMNSSRKSILAKNILSGLQQYQFRYPNMSKHRRFDMETIRSYATNDSLTEQDLANTVLEYLKTIKTGWVLFNTEFNPTGKSDLKNILLPYLFTFQKKLEALNVKIATLEFTLQSQAKQNRILEEENQSLKNKRLENITPANAEEKNTYSNNNPEDFLSYIMELEEKIDAQSKQILELKGELSKKQMPESKTSVSDQKSLDLKL